MNMQINSTQLPTRMSFDTGAVAREGSTAITKSTVALAPESAAAPETQPVSQEKIEAAIKSVREHIKPINNNLEFSIDGETNQVVVKIVDSATREVLRQMPSEEMIAIAKALDTIKGLLIHQKA